MNLAAKNMPDKHQLDFLTFVLDDASADHGNNMILLVFKQKNRGADSLVGESEIIALKQRVPESCVELIL
jgi:hypothetical protein